MSWVKELWVLLYMGVAGVYWTLIEINILERLPRWWRGEPQEEERQLQRVMSLCGRREGEVALVTGANGGTGAETVKELAGLGMTVIMAVRSRARGEEARDDLLRTLRARGIVPGPVEVRVLDLGDLSSVRSLVSSLPPSLRLSVLVLNAGIMCVDYGHSPQGHELHLATNHLGHFLLTSLLLPRLLPGARVLSLVSETYRGAALDLTDLSYRSRPYDRFQAYCDSKAAVLAFALELDLRLRRQGSSIRSCAVNPGSFVSGINQHLPWVARQGHRILALTGLLKSLPQATATSLYCAIAPPGEVEAGQGQVFYDAHPTPVVRHSLVLDPTVRGAIWDISTRLTGAEWTL